MRALTVLAVSSLLAAAGRSQAIVVAGGGTALQQAINTAPVGALLDVMPGTYTPVAASRALRISLRAGANVTAQSPATTLGLMLSGLPAGERFVLDGAGGVAGMSIAQCAGDVVVDGVNHASTWSSSMPVTVNGCTGSVIFHRTTCLGGTGLPWGGMHIGGSAHVSFTACTVPCMVVTSSRVSLNGCTNLHAFAAQPGIDVASGSVVVDGGTVAGGLMFSFPIPMPGIRLAQGDVVVTGGAVIRQTPFLPSLYNAIESTGGSVRLDPSVQVLGAIIGPAPITYVEIPSLAVSHAGSTMSVALTGEPGSAVFTFVGFPAPPIATPWGDAWLSPLDPILDLVVLPANGTHAFSHPFANVTPLVTLVVQSVALSPAALTIGAPVRFVWD